MDLNGHIGTICSYNAQTERYEVDISGAGIFSLKLHNIRTKKYTKRDCDLEALRIDPNYRDAWNNLGVTMTGTGIGRYRYRYR